MYLPDYKLAAQKAIEVLEESEITQAPIVLGRIIDRYSGEIRIVPYSKLVAKGLSLEEVTTLLDSDLGGCAHEPTTNHFIIFYNDHDSNEVIRFTIAHELGHIFLDHHKKAGSNIINKVYVPEEDYKEYEKEANVFARNLLSPAPLAQYIVETKAEDYENWDDLQTAFWISQLAAKIRLLYIDRDLKDYSDEMLAVIDRIKMLYKRCCFECRTVIPKGAIFCLSCGSANKTMGTNARMLPVSVKYSERGFFEHCVQCGNNEFSRGSWFCKICGAPRINLCFGIKDPLIRKRHINPANALFCGGCGNKTVFNQYQVSMSLEEVPAMNYTDGVEYDMKTMRIKICPRCQNEEFNKDAEFCRICGLELINYCEGEEKCDDISGQLYYTDRHPNPSNARFCEKCGKPTVFFKEGILPDYKEYSKNGTASEANSVIETFMSIPAVEDSDLPFA